MCDDDDMSQPTNFPGEDFERAVATAGGVVAAIRDDQFGLPTPCSGWTVREVLNHLLGTLGWMVAVTTDGPMPEDGADHAGADPRATFARVLADTAAGLARPGVPELTVQTSRGDQTGSALVGIAVMELFVHSWDLAKATGQSTDLDADLADRLAAQMAERLGGRPREETPFDEPQPVADGACAADRLAGFLGRPVATV